MVNLISINYNSLLSVDLAFCESYTCDAVQLALAGQFARASMRSSGGHSLKYPDFWTLAAIRCQILSVFQILHVYISRNCAFATKFHAGQRSAVGRAPDS